MRIDGLKVREGSSITNATLPSGAVFPADPNVGELFYLTSGDIGLHVYTEAATWVRGNELNQFLEARNIAAPNATIPVHSFSAIGTETDIDVAFVPKGTGAFVLDIADGTLTGGNKRGAYSVDLQMERAIPSSVASGSWSALLGGYNNKASGNYSVVVGGDSNSATGIESAIVGGSVNVADKQWSTVVGGTVNQAYGLGSIVLGGNSNQAGGAYSVTLGGTYSTTRWQYGKIAFAAGRFVAQGDAQLGTQALRQTTADAVPTILTANGIAPQANVLDGYDNVCVLPNNHAYTIIAYITARDVTTKDMSSWRIDAAVKRGTSALETAIIGTPIITRIAKDAAATAWAVNLVVNTTRGSVEVQVTGETGKTIRWLCKFDTVELG